MRTRQWTVLTLAMCFGMVAGVSQASIVLDPNGFGSGTNVSAIFPGVELSTVNATSNVVGTTIIEPLRETGGAPGPVYATGSSFSSDTHPAVWGPGQALRIDFDGYAASVSVQYLPNDTDTGLLTLFGPSGEVLGDLVDRSSAPFALSFAMSGVPVAYALASYGDTGFIGAIDYEAASTTSEPATLALAALGLIGLGFTRRRNQTT